MAKHFRPWNPKQKWLLPMVDRIKANLGRKPRVQNRNPVTAVAKQPTGTTLTKVWDTCDYVVTLRAAPASWVGLVPKQRLNSRLNWDRLL